MVDCQAGDRGSIPGSAGEVFQNFKANFLLIEYSKVVEFSLRFVCFYHREGIISSPGKENDSFPGKENDSFPRDGKVIPSLG